ncbi:hypothetical protein TMatcc_000082 [Talaromyces marneffei ATCC 18224]
MNQAAHCRSAQGSTHEPGVELSDTILNAPSATEGENKEAVGDVRSNEASVTPISLATGNCTKMKTTRWRGLAPQ